MIKGTICKNKQYGNEQINIAINWLKNTNLNDLPLGKYEISGNEIYAIVQKYPTKKSADLVWEAHKKYIDIHYVFEGIEKMGISEISEMEIISEYEESGDYSFFKGSGIELDIFAGQYIILYPEDVHMPGIGGGNTVGKVVLKVKV